MTRLGLGRSLIALSNLITLIFTSSDELFPIDVFKNQQILDENERWNIFYIFGFENLNWSYLFSIVILVITISGYLPQIICFFHAWISYSILKGGFITEGGDQIAAILSLLLIPICIFDQRINHWHNVPFFKYNKSKYIHFFCYSCLIIIQIQMAILYLDAGIEKMKVPEWIDGTATYYWFNNNVFGAPNWMQVFFGGIFKSYLITPIITWSVMIIEILLFAAFFMNQNMKKNMFLLGLSFHFLIFLTHGLPAFGFAMAGGLVIYLLPIDKQININI
jgi:antimicrobial peptide system SdpB family protein